MSKATNDSGGSALVNKLEKAYNDAAGAASKLRSVMEREHYAEMRKAEALVDAAIDAKYGAEIDRLNAARASALAALNAARVATAKGITLQDRFLPIGARVCTPDGQQGVVEVFTAESVRPVNDRYGLPSLGDCIIRLLKKDGTPGVKLVTQWRAGRFFSLKEQNE